MIKDYRKKLTTKEICEELNITKNGLKETEFRMEWGKVRGPERIRKLKYNTHFDYSGFAHKKTKEKWEKRFKELGFKNLREAVTKLKQSGMVRTEIAIKLGVKDRDLNYRLKRAGIRFREIPKGVIPKIK